MLFRHTRWIVVLAATVLAGLSATAQGPQGAPGSQVRPLLPPPGPAPASNPADLPPLPGVEGGRPPDSTPLAPAGGESLLPLARFRVEPGRPLLEFRGGGVNSPHHGESDRWLDFGILVQGEYIHNSPTRGRDTEQAFFRRLRPTVMGGMGDWQGILQMDFGAGEDGTASATTVRWANFQYTGFYQAHATFGSFKPWFSRELITLGPHLQTIERSPVGDTNYGNPDYMIGISWDQLLPGRKLAYYASLGLQDHQQVATQMQMRSPANAAAGANQGVLLTGRVDYYLFGEMPYDPRPLHTPAQIAYNRGDFHTDAWRVIVSTAAYGWWNDGNSNPFTANGRSTSTTQADLDQAFGFELSGGVRGFGVSADMEYQYVRGDLLASNFTGGLYLNGRTNMNKLSVNGGYMLPHDVELAAGWSVIDASGFDRALTETKVGVNWYVMKYAIRFSATYSFLNNNNGAPGDNIGVTRLDAQFVW